MSSLKASAAHQDTIYVLSWHAAVRHYLYQLLLCKELQLQETVCRMVMLQFTLRYSQLVAWLISNTPLLETRAALGVGASCAGKCTAGQVGLAAMMSAVSVYLSRLDSLCRASLETVGLQ